MTSLKVGVLGASGNVGAQIVKHLSANSVTTLAVARNESKIPSLPHVTGIKGDAKNIEELAPKLPGINTLISALHSDIPFPDLVTLAKDTGANRLVIVGGAGSLRFTENGPRVLESPKFPLEYLEFAKAHFRGLQYLETITDFDWLFVSPPMNINNLPTTGKFRVGSDILLFNENNLSQISYDDYALGLVDEVIHPRHHKQQITIAE